MRVVSWFSCGAASAVATKLAIAQYGKENMVIARCIVRGGIFCHMAEQELAA